MTPSLNASTMETPIYDAMGSTTLHSSRNPSFSAESLLQEGWDASPAGDRLSALDLVVDNFGRTFTAQTEGVQNQSQVVCEGPSTQGQLDRYHHRIRSRVEKLGKRWNDTKYITLREKISFIFGVLNIFVSGYLLGGYPELFHLWYTIQMMYLMPIRFYTYYARGLHYFLADLCYFVNALLLLSLWALPASAPLFTAVYCLAFGNNAVAIVMWRNALVFHSLDKATSLFIHLMPCATLHCLVHADVRHPAARAVAAAAPGLPAMLACAAPPYAAWQLAYYLGISRRRRAVIAAGRRQTSFTWLRRSYARNGLGRWLRGLPEPLQEPAFMAIQCAYAVLTILPCPLWLRSRALSALFLGGVFLWSVWNGGTYYIDIFGKRFQKELEALKAEVEREGRGEAVVAETLEGVPDVAGEPGSATSSSVGDDALVAVATGTEMLGQVVDGGLGDVIKRGSRKGTTGREP